MNPKMGTVRMLDNGTHSGSDFDVTFNEKDVEASYLKEQGEEFTLSGEDATGRFLSGISYKHLELDGEYLSLTKNICSTGGKTLELKLVRHVRSCG